METNPTENMLLFFLTFLLNHSVQKVQPFTHREYLINKFVWHPVPSHWLARACPVVTGCSLLPCVTAQAAFCALGWRPHWCLSWPQARASKPSASYRTGSCTQLWVNTDIRLRIRISEILPLTRHDMMCTSFSNFVVFSPLLATK